MSGRPVVGVTRSTCNVQRTSRRFHFLGGRVSGGAIVKKYPLGEDLLRPVPRVAMPRAPRLHVLPHFVRNLSTGGTMHVVARCNNREFSFSTADDFALLLVHLRELVWTYEVTVYAYLGLSRSATVRQRQYRTLLAPNEDPRADARDPRWTTQRAVGSPAFMAPYVPRLGRRRSETMSSQNQEVRP